MSSMVTVETSHDGRRIDLVLDRPEVLNALSLQMLEEIDRACGVIRDRQPAPRVVVVRSAVPRSFSVGADVNEWERFDVLEASRASLLGLHSFAALAGLAMPVVAVVEGYCFGGGLELALACDLRIAHPSAMFAFPEASLGTGTGWGGLPRLVRLVGPGRAKALLLTGRRLDAERAVDVGLCEFLVDDPAAADDIISAITANAPLPMEIMKRTIDGMDGGLASALHAETLSAGVYAATEDARRAKEAFRAKAPPVEFHGA